MKRLIYLFAALFTLSSCTISEGWNPDQNLVAYKAYDMAITEVYQQIHILSYAQIVDQYSRAGDGEREMIEDQHLPNVRLRQNDEGWDVVFEGRSLLSFKCNTPLGEVDSVWTVKIEKGWNQITNDQFWTIKCTGDNRWQLQQSVHYEERSVNLTLDVVAGDQIEGSLNSKPVYKYTIEGECTITQNELLVAPYRIDMKTIEPIVFDNYKYYTNYTGSAFTEGRVSIRVTNYKSNESVVAPFHYWISPERSNVRIEYLMTE